MILTKFNISNVSKTILFDLKTIQFRVSRVDFGHQIRAALTKICYDSVGFKTKHTKKDLFRFGSIHNQKYQVCSKFYFTSNYCMQMNRQSFLNHYWN